MMRITRTTTPEGGISLRIYGQIRGACVEELQRDVRACLDGTAPAVLDVSEVTYADRQGIHALKQLMARGATVLGASQFVTELLRTC
jgi:anti-anti-sigma regulatory factor